jgi:hypothetical protein
VEPVTSESIQAFLEKLGKSYSGSANFYLLGGTALLLLGNPRSTIDIDYTYEIPSGKDQEFEALVNELGKEMRLDLESVPLGEFIPLDPDAFSRRKWIGQYGNITVYLFDLYTIALSKIARGFETDLDDVIFLINTHLIEFAELERLFQGMLPSARKTDILPGEFLAYFEKIKERIQKKS